MFGIFKPRTFFNLANTSLFWLKIILVFALITGLILALFFSPIDYLQKDTVRIMYVHVPSSWISLFIFLIIGISSFISLIFKLRVFSVYAKSLAPIGLVFSLISVVTGSLWGYPTWGTFWSWDGRLTSMFVLVLTYFLYVSLWSFIKNYNSAEKITNIVGIVGLINIPIIKFSVAWWNTLQDINMKLLILELIKNDFRILKYGWLRIVHMVIICICRVIFNFSLLRFS